MHVVFCFCVMVNKTCSSTFFWCGPRAGRLTCDVYFCNDKSVQDQTAGKLKPVLSMYEKYCERKFSFLMSFGRKFSFFSSACIFNAFWQTEQTTEQTKIFFQHIFRSICHQFDLYKCITTIQWINIAIQCEDLISVLLSDQAS